MSETGERLLRAHKNLTDALKDIEEAINRFDVTPKAHHSPTTWIRMNWGLIETKEALGTVESALESLNRDEKEDT